VFNDVEEFSRIESRREGQQETWEKELLIFIFPHSLSLIFLFLFSFFFFVERWKIIRSRKMMWKPRPQLPAKESAIAPAHQEFKDRTAELVKKADDDEHLDRLIENDPELKLLRANRCIESGGENQGRRSESSSEAPSSV